VIPLYKRGRLFLVLRGPHLPAAGARLLTRRPSRLGAIVPDDPDERLAVCRNPLVAEELFDDERPTRDGRPRRQGRALAGGQAQGVQQRTAGEVCHSFRSLLAELALVVRDTNRITGTDATFTKVTRANPTQAQALALVGLNPERL